MSAIISGLLAGVGAGMMFDILTIQWWGVIVFWVAVGLRMFEGENK